MTAAFLLFTLQTSKSLAQSGDKESLISEIYEMEAASTENIERLNTLMSSNDEEVVFRATLKLARLSWREGRIEKAEAILQSIEAQLDELDPEARIRFFRAQSTLEERKNNFELSLEIMLKDALPLAEPDSTLLAKVYEDIGTLNRHQLNFVEALRYYNKAIEILQRRESEEANLARAYVATGILMDMMGRVPEALDYHRKARVIFEARDNTADLVYLYLSLGQIYEGTGDTDSALEYYQRTLALDLGLNNFNNLAFDYSAIAQVLRKQGDLQGALGHIEQTIELFTQMRSDQFVSNAYLDQAQILGELQNNEARLASLKKAEEAAERADIPMQYQEVHHQFGQYFFDTGDFEAAKSRLIKGLAIVRTTDSMREELSYHELLATVYSELNEPDLALESLETAHRMSKELNNQTKIKEAERYKRDINLMEEQLKVQGLENEKAAQQKELRIQKLNNERTLIVFSIVTLLLVVVGYLVWQRRKTALLRAELYKDALEEKEKMLADVSHELRTPLTSLKLQVDALQHNLIEDVDSSYDKISRKVMDISGLISQINELARSDSASFVLEKTSCNLQDCFSQWDDECKDYVESKGFAYRSELHVPSFLVDIDVQRLRQVLFNLLSNSCFYTDKPGRVEVEAKRDGSSLHITVADIMPAVSDSDLDKILQRLYRVEQSRSRQTGGSGLGLAICNNLVEAHDGTISASKSDLGGLCVSIALPLYT
ncbi:MAG: tetratricopeptide repeat protein [Pseudomonadota bacterium]